MAWRVGPTINAKGTDVAIEELGAHLRVMTYS